VQDGHVAMQDVKRCVEAAKRLKGLTTQSSDTETNGFPAHEGRHAALRPVKLEDTCAEPQMDLKRREGHLHGSGWQDPICSLFQNESGSWQDPICALFQTKTLATCQAEDLEASGSYSLATPPETPFQGSDASSRRVNLKNGTGCADYAANWEREHPISSQVHPQDEWSCTFLASRVAFCSTLHVNLKLPHLR
jgi:hypothetical protein